MKKNRLRYAIGLIVLGIVLAQATGWLSIGFIDSVDRLIYDARLRLTMPRTVDQRLVIVDIDEKSLAEVGRWPWRRDRMAQLVNQLFDTYQVRQLGFDIVMAEPDESSGLRSLDALAKTELQSDAAYQQALQRLRPQLDYDNVFANALKNRPIILGYYLSNEGSTSGALPSPALDAATMLGRDAALTHWRDHGGNLALFQQAAAGAGHFNPIIDPDSSVRRVPLLAFHQSKYYESFSLAMARTYLHNAAIQPSFDGGVLESLKLTDGRTLITTIPVDENAAAWVPYRGPERSYRYVSATDVLSKRVPPDQLRGKIIILGTSAPGLRDLRNTPVGEVYPGMEVHANLITGILDHSIKERPSYIDGLEILVLLAVGLVMIFFFPWQSPILVSIIVATSFVALTAGNFAIWYYANWIMPLAAALLLVVALYVWNMAYGYFTEARAKLQITQRFGQYVPPELVNKMLLDPDRYSMDSRRADLTVLFSDVRSFTSISEGLEPEELADLMNAYLTAMTQVIRRHGGTLDKYIGDAIVAFWGAPIEDPNHARNAVLAALDMQVELKRLNDTFIVKKWPPLQVGIGINTGAMTVGDMGSSIRLAYTVMGDAVNLGARLEGKTKDYGVDIMVGETTCERTPEIVYRELDRVQVKGKELAVTVYQPLGVAADVSAAQTSNLTAWQSMLQRYRAQDWSQAEAALHAIFSAEPQSALYQMYLQRIAAWRASPPGPEWRGVTRFDTK